MKTAQASEMLCGARATQPPLPVHTMAEFWLQQPAEFLVALSGSAVSHPTAPVSDAAERLRWGTVCKLIVPIW
jgi:hypothetical protein